LRAEPALVTEQFFVGAVGAHEGEQLATRHERELGLEGSIFRLSVDRCALGPAHAVGRTGKGNALVAVFVRRRVVNAFLFLDAPEAPRFRADGGEIAPRFSVARARSERDRVDVGVARAFYGEARERLDVELVADRVEVRVADITAHNGGKDCRLRE